MRFCPRCNTAYSDEERVCPKDGAALALRPRDQTQGLAVAPDQEGTAFRPRATPRRGGEDRAEDLIGRQLGNFRVTAIIGRGGMGRVYEAEHVVIRRKVALKVLRPEYAARRDAVMRFIGEATAVNKIRHRNIVDISDFVELEDGTTFIIMELLEGDSLGKVQRTMPRMPLPRLLSLMVQVADALEAAHAVGIIHRDLKPDNIFVCPDGTGGEVAKLLDFGVAKLIAEQQTSSFALETAAGSIVGTPAYMSPEQAIGGDIDGRSDVYALGAILYELATGAPLFEGRNFTEFLDHHRFTAPVPPSQIPGANIGAGMEALILRCVAKKPEDRYQTVAALRADMLEQLGLGDSMDRRPSAGGGRRTPQSGARGPSGLDDVVASLSAPSGSRPFAGRAPSGPGSGGGGRVGSAGNQPATSASGGGIAAQLPQPPQGAHLELAATEHAMSVPAFARSSQLIGTGIAAELLDSQGGSRGSAERGAEGPLDDRRSPSSAGPGQSGRRPGEIHSSSADARQSGARSGRSSAPGETKLAFGGLPAIKSITPRTLALVGGGLGALALGLLVYAIVKPSPGGDDIEGPAEPEITPINASIPALPSSERPVDVAFRSDPPAAEVYVEGSTKLQCRTPCRLSISPDDGGPATSRSFTLKKPGYLEYPVEVSLTERDQQTVTAILLSEASVTGDRPRPPRDRKPDRRPTVDKKPAADPTNDKVVDKPKPVDRPIEKPKPVDRPIEKPKPKPKPEIDPGDTLDPFKS